MSDPVRLTEEELREIHERADAATGGDWKMWNGWGPYKWDGLHRATSIGAYPHGAVVEASCGCGSDIKANKADFEFIAHARTDVPALLSHIDVQDRELADARYLLEAGCREHDDAAEIGTRCTCGWCRAVKRWLNATAQEER